MLQEVWSYCPVLDSRGCIRSDKAASARRAAWSSALSARRVYQLWGCCWSHPAVVELDLLSDLSVGQKWMAVPEELSGMGLDFWATDFQTEIGADLLWGWPQLSPTECECFTGRKNALALHWPEPDKHLWPKNLRIGSSGWWKDHQRYVMEKAIFNGADWDALVASVRWPDEFLLLQHPL